MRFTTLFPREVAEHLYHMGLVSREAMVDLQSSHTLPEERRSKILYTILPHCGYQQRTLALFYFALNTSSYTVKTHRELATQVRLCGNY